MSMLCVVVFLGCSRRPDRGAETKKIRVDHYLQPGHGGVGSWLCMMVDEGNGMQFFYDGIDGFSFTWGTSYELTVKVEKVPDPPADGSSLHYTLVSIDKQNKVQEGTRFAIQVFDREFIKDQSILGQRRFEYASEKVRQDFEIREAVLAATGEAFRAQFRHPSDPEQPLVLEVVLDAR
jgi:hypothetical protein